MPMSLLTITSSHLCKCLFRYRLVYSNEISVLILPFQRVRKDSYGAAVIRAMEKWVHQERDQAQAEVRTLTKQVDAKSKMKSY